MLVEIWGWQAVFAGRLPLALVALALSIILPKPSATGTARLDVVGSALLALWISSLLLCFASLRFNPPAIVPLLLAATALGAFAGFVWRQRSTSEPILKLGIFRDISFSALHIASILTNAAGFAVMLLVPFALSRIAGLNARDGGSLLALSLVGIIAGSFLAPRLCALLGGRMAALAGMLASSAGLGVIGGPAIGPEGMATTAMAMGLLLNGLGLGLFQVAYTDLTVAALPIGDRGVAGSLAFLTRTIGVVSGAAGLSGLFDSAQTAAVRTGATVEIAFRDAFASTLSLASLAVLIAVPILGLCFRVAPRAVHRTAG
jgi:Na+/melibiose symporter-like transporter